MPFVAMLSVSCSSQVNTQTVKGPILERRTRIDPALPIAQSTWEWDGRGFSGKLEWRACEVQTAWKETEQRITKTKPNRTLPYILMPAGGLLSIAGTATYDFGEGTRVDCNGGTDCRLEKPDNSLPVALMLSGGALVATGLLLTLQRPSVRVEDVRVHQKTRRTRAPCIEPRDLRELKLVLQVAPRKFVTIRVEADSTARIDLPPDVTVPRDVDLPVLVYQMPDKAAAAAGRWHTVGHARASSEVVTPSPTP